MSTEEPASQHKRNKLLSLSEGVTECAAHPLNGTIVAGTKVTPVSTSPPSPFYRRSLRTPVPKIFEKSVEVGSSIEYWLIGQIGNGHRLTKSKNGS
ncbi:Hypothetical predicted protein [Olea europaea subsp. europaea]|uniref:Uncharacterized protein n=1 Tax=Olea europaea subsp. europaea TaxID=158383 RepID=A0A8S0VKY6_OLEEU|nr:Hypothetical predicted protein [Olea europaea subsp. europaea]